MCRAQRCDGRAGLDEGEDPDEDDDHARDPVHDLRPVVDTTIALSSRMPATIATTPESTPIVATLEMSNLKMAHSHAGSRPAYDPAVIVERSMHPSWLSNAYVLAGGPGGAAVFVDSGAPLEPLIEVVERERLTPTHLLVTHGHADHVAGNDELVELYGLEVTSGAVDTGRLHVEVLATPGHSDDGVSFVVSGLCFTGDTLFLDAVGGGPAGELRHSVMDVLMTLPHETRVLPGHTDETTIGREWEHNPFVRFWRGLEPEDGRACRVLGDDATLVVWSPDYDGKGKALVRFASGDEAIVGASRIDGL